MKIFKLCLLFLLSISFVELSAQVKLNNNFEILDKNGLPKGWDLTFHGMNTGVVKLDSTTKRQGKYSVSLTAKEITSQGVAIDYEVNQKFSGKELVLIGNLKTENVTDGYAGLWMRVDDRDQQLVLELMEKQDLKGTHDWKEYIIRVPYDEANATSIHFGAVLTGKGQVWVDSLRVYLDEVPIEKAKIASYASTDTLYKDHSGVDTILNTSENVEKLTMLGQVWGFLKYYHPAIARGDYNWDAELFKILPNVLSSSSNATFSALVEKWVDSLGIVPVTKKSSLSGKARVFLKPDYGNLFTNFVLSASLIKKLQFIKDNSNNKNHYYIAFAGAGNPRFLNEKSFNRTEYPDAGIRLLALYRYWNSIQYFSPNRTITDENWNTILPKFIPQVIMADNKYAYVTSMVKLVSSIHDSHGFISSSVFENSLGKYRLPVDAAYIENKLVVTKLLLDSLNVRENFQVGDVIETINGSRVEDLIQKYLPVTSSSHFEVAMRDMVGTYLIRNKEEAYQLTLIRGGQRINVTQRGVLNNKLRTDLFGAKADAESFRLLTPQIGYILGNKFKKQELDSLSSTFKNTKGIILDMRGYPIEELIHTLGSYFGTGGRPFVKFTKGSIQQPGFFRITSLAKSGRNRKPYHGKVIVLVNSQTQSNAEFVTMAFQTSKNVKVIGSTSAGADGNISQILLPGGFKTWISGIGVFYPDGTNAQRTGVKLNLTVKPTIEGIRLGKDEVLEKGMEMIVGQ